MSYIQEMQYTPFSYRRRQHEHNYQVAYKHARSSALDRSNCRESEEKSDRVLCTIILAIWITEALNLIVPEQQQHPRDHKRYLKLEIPGVYHSNLKLDIGNLEFGIPMVIVIKCRKYPHLLCWCLNKIIQ